MPASPAGGWMSSRNSSRAQTTYAVFDEEWPSEPPSSIRTPPPPFDLQAFAADSECRLRACAEADRRSTAPPPPYHGSVFPSGSKGDTAIAPLLVDCARRTDLARAQLRVGSMSAEEASRAICAELARVRDAGPSEALSTLTATLGSAFAELGGFPVDENGGASSVLVLEDDVDLRDRLTLSLEAIGYRVHAACRSEALTELAAHNAVAVIVGVDPSSESSVWELLRGVLPLEGVSVVVGGRSAAPGLEALAAEAGADAFIRFDLGVHELIEELGTLFSALGLAEAQALSA